MAFGFRWTAAAVAVSLAVTAGIVARGGQPAAAGVDELHRLIDAIRPVKANVALPPVAEPPPVGEPRRPVRAARVAVAPAILTWTGIASWYGGELAGRRTASGERFDPDAHTAAHRTLPFGAVVRVTSLRTGLSVEVRINDRGPHVAGREIDLSRAAAEAIGIRARGMGEVRLERVR